MTEVGGDVLQIEATLVDGTGKLTLTGKLGDVMQESAQAAITYIRSRAVELGIPQDFHKNYDLHVHVPEEPYQRMVPRRESRWPRRWRRR